MMSRAEMTELTVMCMVCDGDRILVQEKVNGGWMGLCFPGGHVERDESFVKAAMREVREETGLEIEPPSLCGVKQFKNDDGERYIVMLFKTDCWHGEPRSSEEGKVFWINRADISKYELAESFAEMYEVFVRDDISEQYSYFNGVEWVRELY